MVRKICRNAAGAVPWPAMAATAAPCRRSEIRETAGFPFSNRLPQRLKRGSSMLSKPDERSGSAHTLSVRTPTDAPTPPSPVDKIPQDR